MSRSGPYRVAQRSDHFTLVDPTGIVLRWSRHSKNLIGRRDDLNRAFALGKAEQKREDSKS